MEDHDRIKILKNLVVLCDNIEVENLIPYLMQDLILNYTDSEVIKHEITKRDQAGKLLEIIQHRGPTAFQCLINALQHDYDYLATLVVKTAVLEDDPKRFSLTPEPFPNGVETKKPSSDDDVIAIQEELKNFYDRSMRYMAPVPWLESYQVELNSVYVNLQMVRTINRNKPLHRDEDKKALATTSDLFVDKDGKTSVKRVLVEGDPGIGKTTFSCKLCHDWATENSDNVLGNFDLVFIVKARELDARKSMINCLYELLMPEDFKVDQKQFQKQIENNQDQVLIIVDGYDEMTEPHADFNKLINGRILSRISVLVTSRPGFALNMIKCFESIFVIVGYGEQQRLEFIRKFVAAMCEEQVLARFESFKARLVADEVLSQLCRNPLHLCILCLLIEDAATTSSASSDLPQTKTELYQEVEEFIIRRSAGSQGRTYDELKAICSPLDQMAYHGLLRGDSSVTEAEAAKYCDVEQLKYMGFFCCHVAMSRFRHVTKYAFMHKSFQEYFAAKYIATPRRTKQERLDMARELLQTGNNKLVMVFLCGLLQKNNYALVDLLDILKDETFLPFIATESLSLHDVNENHNAHTLFHCLREIDTIGHTSSGDRKGSWGNLQDKLGPRMLSCKVEQVSLSYPWCSGECLDGVLELVRIIDRYCLVCAPSATPTSQQRQQKTFKNHSNLVAKASKSMEGDLDLTSPTSPVESSSAASTSVINSLKHLHMSDMMRRRASKDELGPPRFTTTGATRPKSLESYIDDKPPVAPRRHNTKNLKMIFQRALVEMRGSAMVTSPQEHAKCKKFSLTVPGPLVSERQSLFTKFMKELAPLRHVETFSVHDVTTFAQVQTLFSVLAHVGRPRVTSIALRFVGVLDVQQAPVHIDAGYFIWMQSLTLIDCPSAEVLLAILSAIPSANSLRYLSFVKCSFDADAFRMLCAKLKHMKCLKTFDFRQNSLRPSGVELLELLQALEPHQHLAHFGISNLMTRSSPSAPNFIELHPRDDSFLSHMTPYLCQIIASNSIESLYLSNSTLGGGLLGMLNDAIKGNHTIRRLELPCNYVVPEEAVQLTNVIRNAIFSATVDEINLLGTELSPDNFHGIRDVLSNSGQLRSLSLGIYNGDDLTTFSEGLLYNQSLRYLDIRKIIFGDDTITDFSNAVAKHPSLRTLILSTNDMTPVKINSLFTAIKNSSLLQHVALKHFRLEDLHMIEFSQVLGKNENLIKVDLQSNKIGPSGVELLYKKIQYRSKLWKMNLSDNAAKEFHDEVKLLKRRVLYLKVNWW